MVGEKVRRWKAAGRQRCNSRPETGSLHRAVMRVHGGLTNHLRCTSTLPVQITRRVLSESPWLQQLLESARNVIGFADLAIYNLLVRCGRIRAGGAWCID